MKSFPLFPAIACLVLLWSACAEEARERRGEITVSLGKAEAVFRPIQPSAYKIDYPDFYMLETEVTNLQFQQYLAAAGKTKDDSEVLEIVERRKKSNSWSTGDVPYRVEDAASIWRQNQLPAGQESCPVTLVTLHDATDFCRWLSEKHPRAGLFRLPTWNEWMVAAYGEKRRYPWGDDWDTANVHMSYGFKYPDFPKRTEDVKGRLKGRTPEGLYGMLGNAAEYLHASDPTHRGYFNCGSRWMGGGFTTGRTIVATGKEDERVAARQDYWGYSHSAAPRECDLGFRVVLDASKDTSLLERPRLFGQQDKRWTGDEK